MLTVLSNLFGVGSGSMIASFLGVEKYDEAVKDEPKEIVTLLKFGVFRDGKNHTEEIDITKYVDKVRDYNKE